MTKQQLKDILDRVLAWSPEDQERLIAHREVASDAEAKTLFDSYRGA